ncbi:MAG: hypothetical protein OEL89_01630 [Candidatus Peregrinibacteria bacterium]|nr:hypothetical protein [Candidatus Peregrinibacteria bacterium]
MASILDIFKTRVQKVMISARTLWASIETAGLRVDFKTGQDYYNFDKPVSGLDPVNPQDFVTKAYYNNATSYTTDTIPDADYGVRIMERTFINDKLIIKIPNHMGIASVDAYYENAIPAGYQIETAVLQNNTSFTYLSPIKMIMGDLILSSNDGNISDLNTHINTAKTFAIGQNTSYNVLSGVLSYTYLPMSFKFLAEQNTDLIIEMLENYAEGIDFYLTFTKIY